MVRRKPLRIGLTVLSILLCLLVPLVSAFFLIPTIVFFFLRWNTPFSLSKCPRCRKNNELEPWVGIYSCAHCQALLKKDENNWSRLL